MKNVKLETDEILNVILRRTEKGAQLDILMDAQTADDVIHVLRCLKEIEKGLNIS